MVDYTVAGVEGGVCAPRGFRAAGVDAGLTPGQGPDLALIVSQQAAAAAAAVAAASGLVAGGGRPTPARTACATCWPPTT